MMMSSPLTFIFFQPCRHSLHHRLQPRLCRLLLHPRLSGHARHCRPLREAAVGEKVSTTVLMLKVVQLLILLPLFTTGLNVMTCAFRLGLMARPTRRRRRSGEEDARVLVVAQPARAARPPPPPPPLQHRHQPRLDYNNNELPFL